VIPMLTSMMGDLFHGPAADRESPVMKRRLYAPVRHWVARVGYGTMGIGFVAFIAGMVMSRAHEELPGGAIVVGIAVVLLAGLILVTNLRTSALYGSPEGLEMARWGKRRVFAWSSVGTAEYAWWSTNYASRIATVTIRENTGRERNVLFFASDRVLEDFETMRSLYTRA